MGYARILSGGPDGRYSIELDYGAATRTALIAALNALVASITVKLDAAQVKLTTAEAKEAVQRARIAAAQQKFIDDAASLPPGSPKPLTVDIRYEMQQLQQMLMDHVILRQQVTVLKFDYKTAQGRLIYWQSFTPTETRNAWCVDFTEDASVGALVGTVDIPGESNLLLIAEGARGWNPADGVLAARELMSPEQAFFNAAILPGWQKDKPTYRWGTITALDQEADTADVDLFEAVSSAQRLPINQGSSLSAVPIEYMTCNSSCFEVGDRVVVKFDGQNWGSPRVIGFLDNPKPCGDWDAWYAGYISGASRTDIAVHLRDGSELPFSTFFAAALAGTLTADYRIDRGSWVSLSQYSTFDSTTFYDPAVEFGSSIILSISDGFVGGFHMRFSTGGSPGGPDIPPGSIIEARIFMGAEIAFNGAFQQGPAASVAIKLNGQLDNDKFPTDDLMTRLAYSLFEQTGT